VAWIKTVPFTQADEPLRRALDLQQRLYPAEYSRDPGDDGSGSIVSTHTLFPDVLYHAFATFGALLSAELPLTRRQHEMITTRVSALNRCHH
jgi:hypothetical protein